MKTAWKSAVTPIAFEHWQKKLGFGNRVEMQAWQTLAKRPLQLLNAVVPGKNPRLEKAVNWLEQRINKLQEDPYRFSSEFNAVLAHSDKANNRLIALSTILPPLFFTAAHMISSGTIPSENFPTAGIWMAAALLLGKISKKAAIREVISEHLKFEKEKDTNKQAENVLLQTHQNYATFFNAIEDFIFILDTQGNILHTNTTVNSRLGYSSEELFGRSVLMIHPSERRAEAGKIVGEMLRGTASVCPVPIITKSGIQIPVETKVTPGSWNGLPAIFGITKDISQLALLKEKFAKLFDLNPSACGLSSLDDRRYLEVNEAFYTLLGFDKNEVIGKTALELGVLTPETMNAVMQKTDSNGNVLNMETQIKTKNGDIKRVLLSSETIQVQDKHYRLTVVHDITERKQAEEE